MPLKNKKMTDAYTIAPAALRDLPRIPPLEQAAMAIFATEDLPTNLRYRVTDRATLRQAQEDRRLWVALDSRQRPVGFALAEQADGQAYLSELDVHPEHSRRGLGTRLVAAVVDWARREAFESVLLVTFRHLPWNAPFYESLGFVQMAESELGPDLREFIEEEAQAGINADNRVGMRRDLQSPTAEHR